jgi:septal ring factor EnvC (AmiA/AmiB activator)
LENEVSEKGDLLSHSKNHAANVEAEHNEISSTVKTLQKSVKDKESRIASLEQKNEDLLEDHEKESQNMQQQIKSLQTKVLEKEVCIFLCCPITDCFNVALF